MSRITCAECHQALALSAANEPCPACGALDRAVEDADEALALESLRVEVKRLGWKEPVMKLIRRHKVSKRGRKAREEQDYDRSHPEITTKRHHVQERGTDGMWQVVHDTFEVFPSKHRSPAPGDSKGTDSQ